MYTIYARPNFHNLLLARGELPLYYALSDLALSQSERALYWQQTKGI